MSTFVEITEKDGFDEKAAERECHEFWEKVKGCRGGTLAVHMAEWQFARCKAREIKLSELLDQALAGLNRIWFYHGKARADLASCLETSDLITKLEEAKRLMGAK